MKIAFACNIIEPTGGDHILYHHVIGLRQLGHIVDIYACGWHDQYPEGRDFSNEKVNILGDDLPSDMFNKYDILVVNGLFGAKKLMPVSHPNKVWFLQNFDPWVFGYEVGKCSDIDNVYNHYNQYISYSHDLEKIVKNYYLDKKFVICSNGIEYSKFKTFQSVHKSNVKKVFFMSAYYGKLKGVYLANDIFAELRKRNIVTVEINVVNGPLPNSDEYYVSPSFEDKCRIMSECQVCLHASIFETWGLVPMESMAVGTPVVGTDSKGISEYANSSNFILFQERDVKLISDAIENLLMDSVRYERLRLGGIDTASLYDWNNVIYDIEESYKKFLL